MNGSHPTGESPLPLPSPFLRFFPFDGGGVLFLEGSRRIWCLNTAAAFLWRSLKEIRRFDDLAEALAKTFSLDESAALRDTASTLSCFAAEGLLGEGRTVDLSEGSEDWEVPLSAHPLAEPTRWPLRKFFRTPGNAIEFCSQASVGRTFARYMEHLALNSRVTPDTRLAVVKNDSEDAWDIYLDGRRFFEGAAEDEVLPHLFTLVFVRTCAALEKALLFHAAVLGRQEKMILLPAEAGSGKTTLAAALAARGWRFFSDELAILDIENLRVSPFPMPMSIKPGSVQALERYYPGLASGSVHHRADGKHVRYLSPPPASLTGTGNRASPIEIIAFPIYLEGAENRLAPLAKIDALQRLATTGSSDREFLSSDIEAMLSLVEQTPCYELVFSNLEEALDLLEELIRG